MSKRIDIRVPDDVAQWFDELRSGLGGARGAQVLAMIKARIPDAATLLGLTESPATLTEHSRTVPADSVSSHGESLHDHGAANSRSAHGVLTESPAKVTEYSRSLDPLRGCDSRAPVPAFLSERERTEEREISPILSSIEDPPQTRAVTVQWLVGRWNRWAEARRGEGFNPKLVDLLTERPSRSYVEALTRVFHSQKREHPDPEEWARAFDALDALPDHAARMLRLTGPDTLFRWSNNDPAQRPRLWRIADGEWSTWTGDTKQIAATPKPKHHTYESDDTFCAIPIDGSSPDAKRAVLLADSCWDDTLTEEQREQALLETLAICERNHWDPISRLHVDWVDNRTIRSQR